MFQKAERKKAKLRLALCGPSGGGKTYSSIKIAHGLGGKIAMIDTEQGSGELYADLCDYDVARLTQPFTPQKYVQAIKAAEQAGYNTLIIDSLSHAWSGQGGILEEVDKRKGCQKNQFTAWRDVTPMHNALVEAILQSTCHVIVTMRSKTVYDLQKDDQGKLKPMKIGLAPIQRDGMEYEFTVVLDVDPEKHIARSSKDRTGLFDGQYFVPDVETGEKLLTWLNSGIEPPASPRQPPEQKTTYDDPAPPPQGQTLFITEQQRKKIYALASEMKLDNTALKERVNGWLAKTSNSRKVESLSELKFSETSALIEAMEMQTHQANEKV